MAIAFVVAIACVDNYYIYDKLHRNKISLTLSLSLSLSLLAKSHKKSSQTGEMLEMKKTMTRMRADMNGYKKEIVDKEKALTLYQQQEQKTENDHTETLTEMKRALSLKVR